MVLWNGALMFWKSGRRPFPALSTAESELLEAIEGLQTGDAVDSMIQEHKEPYVKTLFVDNLAATGFFSDGHANWRTRHLRLRAQHVRWRITNLDWRVRRLCGVIMIADLGTKPLPVQRTLELKELMPMILQRKVEEEKKKEDGPETARKEEKKETNKKDGPQAIRGNQEEDECQKKDDLWVPKVTSKQLQLAVMMALIAQSKAQGRDEHPQQPDS